MGCPSKLTVTDNRVRIQHKSWNSNYYFYKSIGSEVKSQLRVKKRRWWCLWLCKTWGWKNWPADRLRLGVSFYSDGKLLQSLSESGSEVKKLKIKHFAVGLLSISINESGSVTGAPEGAPDIVIGLPVNGVKSDATGATDAWLSFAGLIILTKKLEVDQTATSLGSITYDDCTGAGEQPN